MLGPRCLSWFATACVATSFLFACASQGLAQAQAKASAEAADSVEATMTLRNGQSAQCQLVSPEITIETTYGSLKVPTRDVLVIYHGVRTDAVPAANIGALVKGLGGPVFEDREAAQKRLIEIGPSAVPLLKEATKSDDAEIAERASKILEQIGLAAGTGQPEKDSVVAKEFTIVGKISLKAYKIKSAFGANEIPIAEVDRVAVGSMHATAIILPAKLSTAEPGEMALWRAASKEEIGWHTTSYDDTQWVVPTPDSGYIYCADQELGTYAYVRRSFLLNSPPGAASLTIAGNPYEAYVNGVKIGGGTTNTHNITANLRQGVNVIAIKARYSASAYGCSVTLTIE